MNYEDNEALDFFTDPTNTDSNIRVTKSSISSDWSVSNRGPLMFTIHTRKNEYLDLTKTYLKLVVQVTKDDGTAIENISENWNDQKSAPEISLPCDFFDALIRNMKIRINGTPVGGACVDRPQAAMIKLLLSVNRSYVSSVIKESMAWIPDVGEDFRKQIYKKIQKERL